MAKQRRIDLVEKILIQFNGSARLQDVLEKLREIEKNPDVSYPALYLAIQLENEKLRQAGKDNKFLTSKDGAPRGWVQLHRFGEEAQDSGVLALIRQIEETNKNIHKSLYKWLLSKPWRDFESTFLQEVLEELGFQNIEVTQPSKDGGIDARVSYSRGIVRASAIVSAKRWGPGQTIGVDHIRMMRGIVDNSDTAIIITTGKFSEEAKTEALLAAGNNRTVYLIDGDMLVQTCMKLGIGVKRVKLPELIILDQEVVGTSPESEAKESQSDEPIALRVSRASKPGDIQMKRVTEMMIGNSTRGLTVSEVATLTGYAESSIRTMISQKKKKQLADIIRNDPKKRRMALHLVSMRRRSVWPKVTGEL